MGYYNELGISATASSLDIKNAYRMSFIFARYLFLTQLCLLLQGAMAIKYHPGKNTDNPEAEERFKRIARAYSTLSDPARRFKYNELGHRRKDPEDVFSAILGGTKFTPIIGESTLVRDLKADLQKEKNEKGSNREENATKAAQVRL